jgi:hypothetical protein
VDIGREECWTGLGKVERKQMLLSVGRLCAGFIFAKAFLQVEDWAFSVWILIWGHGHFLFEKEWGRLKFN